MSHKVAAPPMAPFPGGSTAYVDNNSTSVTEDGTSLNPYKTIQAALNAIPTGGGLYRTITIAPGTYDEALTLPTQSTVTLVPVSPGTIFLGVPLGTPRNVTWSPVFQSTGIHRMTFEHFVMNGAITVSAPLAGVSPELVLKQCEVAGTTTTGTIYDSTVVLFDFQQTTTSGLVSVDAVFAGERSIFQAAVTAAQGGRIANCQFLTSLTINGAPTSFEILNTSITTDATLTNCGLLTGVTIGGLLSLAGTKPRIYNSNITGALTSTGASFDVAHASAFYGGVTLDAIPTRGFFGCYLAGSFTGPSGSYRVDSTTAADSGATLVSPATEDAVVVSGPPSGSAGGGLYGSYPDPYVSAAPGLDSSAVHSDVASEFFGVTEKVTPISADLLLIEDSAASYAKKKVQIGNLPGGTGGGALIKTYTFSHTSEMGPAYYSGSGGPTAPTGQIGSIYYDTTGYDVYLKTSGGWGSAVVTGVTPFLAASPGYPYDYMGSDGDYYIDTEAAVVWGPKAAGTWVGSDTPLWSWSMVALAGSTPDAGEGVEGDWGWSNDGTYIRIYGPKSTAFGWPTEYNRYLASGIDTGKISLVNQAVSTSFDEIRVLGGNGAVYNNSSPTTIASYNGYCLWKRAFEVTGLSVPASHLLLGATVDVTALTSSPGTPVVGGFVGTVLALITSGGTSPVPGVSCTSTGSFNASTIQEFTSGGNLTVAYLNSSYGSFQSMAYVTEFQGTVKFFFLPE